MITTRYVDVAFNGGRFAMARALYQYDYGQILRITDLDLPVAYEVHFAEGKTGNSVTQIGNADGVNIPDAMFLKSGSFYAWFYLHETASDGETRYEILFPVMQRAKPTNETPTPVQQDAITEAIAALNAAVEQTGADVIASGESASAAADSADEASGYASDASASAINAGEYAEDAQGYASSASESATAAGNAKTAADTAQGKAETAQGKAESAQTAAEAAAAQTALDVIAAGQSADAAAGSAGEASGYANDASEYATVAQGFANNASGFADNASGYATNAYNSATAAAGSAGEASGYASDASGYATAAGNAKTDAEAAQTAAETAQGLAESAQTGAEAAQTAAESARDAAIAATEDKAPVILDSASGNIVSISDGAGGMNARSLVASMSPIQNLNGYSYPWTAGGGSNIWGGIKLAEDINNAITAELDTTSKTISFALNANPSGTSDASCVFTTGITFEENTVYTLITDGTAATLLNMMFKYTDGTTDRSLGRNPTIGAFSSASGKTVQNIVYRSYTGTTVLNYEKCGLFKGSISVSDFAPYSNICPITGRTGLTAYRTGVNVWDEEWELGVYDSTTGQPSSSTYNIRSKNKIPVSPSTQYFAYIGETLKRLKILYYKEDGTFISYEEKDDATFTTPSDCTQIAFSTLNTYGETYLHDISINYPATDTVYHAHTGNNAYPVSWQSEAGTVYGGTVDVVTGVLTVANIGISFDGTEDWKAPVDSGYFLLVINESADYGVSNTGTCSHLPLATNITAANSVTGFRPYGRVASPSGFVVIMRFDPTKQQTLAEFKSYLATQNIGGTPVTVVYELATPVTYQLTPTQVQMLIGANNVWATGDTVDLTYPCDTRLYIEKLTEPTEDDMTANANITSGQYFMVGNSLYYSTAAITAGQSIVVGTNCNRVSLADALNAINS